MSSSYQIQPWMLEAVTLAQQQATSFVTEMTGNNVENIAGSLCIMDIRGQVALQQPTGKFIGLRSRRGVTRAAAKKCKVMVPPTGRMEGPWSSFKVAETKSGIRGGGIRLSNFFFISFDGHPTPELDEAFCVGIARRCGQLSEEDELSIHFVSNNDLHKRAHGFFKRVTSPSLLLMTG